MNDFCNPAADKKEEKKKKKNFARYLIIVYHLVSQRAIDKANFYVTLLELSIIRYNHDPANIQHQGLPTQNFPPRPAKLLFQINQTKFELL